MKNILKEFSIARDINLMCFRRKWRKLNKFNYTIPNNKFLISKVSVGKYTYGELNIHSFGVETEKLEIGSFCSIAPNVHFLLSGEHNYKNFLSYPIKDKIFDEKETISKGKIVVEDDVWIGYGSIILSGVTIGKGAVIGAGSIVAKNVPPFAIFAGNKIQKYRFSDEIISELITLDYNKLNKIIFDRNIDRFYEEITLEQIKYIKKEIDKNEY